MVAGGGGKIPREGHVNATGRWVRESPLLAVLVLLAVLFHRPCLCRERDNGRSMGVFQSRGRLLDVSYSFMAWLQSFVYGSHATEISRWKRPLCRCSLEYSHSYVLNPYSPGNACIMRWIRRARDCSAALRMRRLATSQRVTISRICAPTSSVEYYTDCDWRTR